MLRPTRVTAQSREQMMAQRRVLETSQRELQEYVAGASKLSIAAAMETAVPQKRRQARNLKLEAEARLADLASAQKVETKRREITATEDASVANALARRAAEREREAREMARICGESEELKALERDLKVAYMNKERAAQHEEKLDKEARERAREREIDATMESQRLESEFHDATKKKAKEDTFRDQKASLHEQIMEREARKIEAMREASRDKAMVDAIVAKIEAEDAKDIAEKAKRKTECRALIHSYEAQRKREVELKRQKDAEDDEEIRKHAEQLALRAKAERQKETEKKKRDAEHFRRIVAETEKQRAEETELQSLRDALWEEEMEAARRDEEKMRAERRLALKKDMAAANYEQLKAKELRALREKEEEAKRVDEMRRKFADDEQLEKEAAERRKSDKLHFIDAVARQKQERAAMYEAAKKTEVDEARKERDDDAYRARVVAEARRRLLAQHAHNLDGFLPKGVLLAARDDDDAAAAD